MKRTIKSATISKHQKKKANDQKNDNMIKKKKKKKRAIKDAIILYLFSDRQRRFIKSLV
jgi:hypothetical protein